MTTPEQLSAAINTASRNGDHGTHAALLTLRESVARDAEELEQLRQFRDQAKWLKKTLRDIVESLPKNRDWLDPMTECVAKALLTAK